MSHRLRILVLALCVPAALTAQTHQRMTGLTAGFVVSTLGGDDLKDAAVNSRAGLAVGVFGSFAMSPSLSFQPEVIFVEKGADFTAADGTLGGLKTDYVQIPALLRFRFGGDHKTVPFLMAGPSLAFRIGCDVGITLPGGFTSKDCDAVSVTGVASSDFTAIVGAGVEIGNLLVSARYDYGFSSLHLGPNLEQVYNRAFVVMAAFGFRAW